jgi:outer membrane lipoprotein-sorting protein
MRQVALVVCVAFAIGGSQLFAGPAEDSARILRDVDALRNPLTSFSLDLALTSFRKMESEVWTFRVYGQGHDQSVVEFLSPASEKGKFLLMRRDGMWTYVPSASRPIRISPLQRLMGEVSNGDVARTSYSADYIPESVTAEDVDGTPALVLDLKARDADLSYSRIRLWVARRDNVPIKADYYVSSGKLVKQLLFRELGTVNGSRMITKIEVLDALRPDRRTEMVYSRLEGKQLPEKMFQPSYLGKW